MGEVTSLLPNTSPSSLPPLLYNVPSSWTTHLHAQEPKKKCEGNKEAKEPSQKLPKSSSNEETKKEGTEGKGDEPNTNGEEKSTEEEAAVPTPPEEILMRVFMHCEGCARKVQRCLRSCDGVEDVSTDCRAHRVLVKGKVAAADPVKIAEKLQRKTGRRVELLSPIPPKPEEVEGKEEEKKPEEEESPKPEEKKEEPQMVAAMLKVHMHCEACAQEIKKRILKLKGVKTVEPEQKASQVTVTGTVDAKALVDYVYRRTGKHAAVLKEEVVEVEKGTEGGEDSKGEEEGGAAAEEGGGAVKDADNGGGGEDGSDGGEEVQREEETAMAARLMEMRRNEMMMYYYYYQQQQQQQQQQYHPRYHQVEYAYPPQTFSDENPNACSLM